MKKLFYILFSLGLLFLAKPVFALNDYSTDLDSASSMYFNIADGSQTGLDIDSDFTFEGWFQLETAFSEEDIRTLINKNDNDGNQRAYRLSVYKPTGANHQFELSLSSNGSGSTALTSDSFSEALQTLTWYHFSVTYDLSAGEANFYLNGIKQGATKSGGPTSLYNSTEEFIIGRATVTGSGVYYWNGRFDDFRIWTDIRTVSEINNYRAVEIDSTTSSLVAYFEFENDANDSTSNGNNLTENNSPTYPDGPAFNDLNAYSISLTNGSSTYLSVSDNTSLSIKDDISAEGWYRFKTLPSVTGKMTLVSKGGAYDWYIGADDKMTMSYTSDGASVYTDQNSNAVVITSAELGNWIHYAATCDVSSKSCILYKNGLVIASTPALTGGGAASIVDNAADFTLGANVTPNFYLDALVDEVRLWNDVRTPAELINSSTSWLTGSENHLVGNWRFENNANDTSTSTNNLTENNSPTYTTDDRPFYETEAVVASVIKFFTTPIMFGF